MHPAIDGPSVELTAVYVHTPFELMGEQVCHSRFSRRLHSDNKPGPFRHSISLANGAGQRCTESTCPTSRTLSYLRQPLRASGPSPARRGRPTGSQVRPIMAGSDELDLPSRGQGSPNLVLSHPAARSPLTRLGMPETAPLPEESTVRSLRLMGG